MTIDDPGLTDALEGYSINSRLGRGAMGEVYGARHVKLGRDVAVKKLPPGFAADPDVRRRFGTEAQVLASLDHPHVVPVYDFVERDDLCLLVMQSLPGGTVWERFVNDGVSMPTACAIALATCAGLDHAHRRNVLHRDVKPDNLMFDEHRQLKVTDFGIATVLGGSGTLATPGGQVMGTPAYMAPEQADGSTVGPAADVYAVATMLYELLTGRLPFSEEGDPMDLLRRRTTEEPQNLSEVADNVPEPIASVVMQGLARDPKTRPGSAETYGVQIAQAAVQAWGPAWLTQTDVKLLAGGALANAASTQVGPNGTEPGGATPRNTDVTRGGVGGSANETIAPGADAPERPAARQTAAGEAARTVVRPTQADRPARAGPDISDLDPGDMVPVSNLLKPLRAPWGWIGLLVVSMLLCLASAFTGLGTSGSKAREVMPGEVTIAGGDAGLGAVPEVDLSQPLPVNILFPDPDAATLQMYLSVGGVPIGSSNEVPVVPEAGSLNAILQASATRLVPSGPVDAELRLRDAAGTTLGSPTVEIDPQRLVWLSAAGWATIALSAVVVAYLFALAKPLLRGRRRTRSTIAMAVVGALGGATMVLWGWCLGGAQPSVPSLVFSALAGAAAGMAGASVLFLSGRRRRVKRRIRSRARARADAAR
ncbi:MAG: serine/threonine-protein kinase [Microthrixaceae bacterium]